MAAENRTAFVAGLAIRRFYLFVICLFCLYMWGYDRRLLVKLRRYSSRNAWTANLSLVNTWDRIFFLPNRLCHWPKKSSFFRIPFSFCVVFFKRISSTSAHSGSRRNIRRTHEVNATNFGRFPWPEVAWTGLTITWPISLTQNTFASWKSSFRNIFRDDGTVLLFLGSNYFHWWLLTV